MSQVFIGYDGYGIAGVDDEFIRFIFDVTLGTVSRSLSSEVGLIIASDDQMQHLNHRYRGKNQLTNVLSFNNQEMIAAQQIEPDREYLGDIYICASILVQEAERLNISEKERFAQLFVHGLLHLLGFDHEQAQELAEMEVLEDKIVQLIS